MSVCQVCSKRLKLSESVIFCKCKKVFCNKHRSSYSHDCLFDYKKNQREFLSKKLFKMNDHKMRKI